MAACADYSLEGDFSMDEDTERVVQSSELTVIPEEPELDNILKKIFNDEFSTYLYGKKPAGFQDPPEDKSQFMHNTPEAVEAYRR